MREQIWPEWLSDYLLDGIKKTKPDVAGFSLWDFYDDPKISLAVATVIKKLKKELEIPVIIGGPGTVTKTARRDIMSIFKPDFIVHHEGETALIDLLEIIEKLGIVEESSKRGKIRNEFKNMTEKNKIEKIGNISFRDYDGENRPIEDLDSLALPDFSHYDLDKFFLPVRVLPVMTSRGCPWSRCAFCNHHATYKGYREYSAIRVREMIEECKKKYKTDMIMFHDETFTSNRARNILDFLPEAYYYSYAYPKGFDRVLLKRMYEKGFRVLVWGVESGCQDVLNSMVKGTYVNEVEGIIRDSHSVGITNVAFIMFGFPGETEEQANQTVRFLERNAPYIERHATTQFRLEEDSPVWINPKHWGVKKLKLGYATRSGMSQEEIKEFMVGLNKSNIKTAANTKYYMPGDSEMRAYFFMQVVYCEGSGEYLVRNGILHKNEIIPSILMKDITRPVVRLDEKQKIKYGLCDGKHRVDAKEFLKYPYVVNYGKRFG